MPVTGFDHAAIPTGRPEELLRFYRALGFGIVNEDEWRQGTAAAFSIVFGDNKVNIHPPELWRDNPRFTLRAPAAVPGCGDFCFVWDGSAGEVMAAVQSAGAPVIEGPVSRVGGRDRGATEGTSVYTRDPDGNLLEFIVYPAGPGETT